MICKLAYLFYCVLVSYRILMVVVCSVNSEQEQGFECAFNHGLVVALFMNLFYEPLLSILGRCIMIMGRLVIGLSGFLTRGFIGFPNSRLWSLLARIICLL